MMMSNQNQHQHRDIVAPHDHDVLSGRGNFVNYHAGNEHFRALVRKYKVPYVACPKPQKGKFSRMIVDEIRSLHPPGRFLKQDHATKLWYDIGEKKSLDKTRQALREGAPDIMKDIGGEDDSDDSSENPASPNPDSSASQPMKKVRSRRRDTSWIVLWRTTCLECLVQKDLFRALSTCGRDAFSSVFV
jgi:hypothetical protein